MNEEYIKVKITTFYSFMYFLSLLVDWSVDGKDESEYLNTFLKEIEKEVIREMDGET